MTNQEFQSLSYWDKNTLDYKNRILFTDEVIQKTDIRLMLFFEELQHQIQDIYPFAQMIFHCLYESRSTGGQHPLGLAGDFHLEEHLPNGGKQALFPDFARDIDFIGSILEQMEALNMVGWGIYPQWSHPGHHLDIRGAELGEKDGGWRWGQLWDAEQQSMHYVDFEEAYQRAGRTF